MNTPKHLQKRKEPAPPPAGVAVDLTLAITIITTPTVFRDGLFMGTDDCHDTLPLIGICHVLRVGTLAAIDHDRCAIRVIASPEGAHLSPEIPLLIGGRSPA
jgi:hypothetical protein